MNVIAVVSNPCGFKSRYDLAKNFITYMETQNVNLVVVELIYPNQEYILTEKTNANHLQIKSETPLWHKENMINLGVKLLPKDYKSFAWIDADLSFENTNWVEDTQKALEKYDIVQIFSQCLDLDKNEEIMNISTSAGFFHCNNKKPFQGTGLNYWHPGYAWAITREAYEKINGLYDKAILGSGDNIMLHCLLGNGLKAINENSSEGYKRSIQEFELSAKTLKFGFVHGTIKHYFHGKKEDRKYNERWKILVNYNYSPDIHTCYDNNGVLSTTKLFDESFKNEIKNYFYSRNEDYLEKSKILISGTGRSGTTYLM